MLKKQKGLFKWKLCSGHSLRSWRDKRGSVGFFWRGIREKGEYTSQLQVRGKIPPGGIFPHGLVKWYAQFRTSKFLPGIAFIVFKNQFHAPKNCESKPETERLLETGIKDGFKKRSHKFPFGISYRQNTM